MDATPKIRVIRSAREMQRAADEIRSSGRRIAFVPTMGYLHEGHASLLRRGRALGDVLVLSIFVNPTQFGAGEDLDRYPRDFERDHALAERELTDIIFHPDTKDMYPAGYQTEVRVQKVSAPLCGLSRPVHFAGVATVCTKLFNIVKPHVAVFGEKDFQQYLVIDRLVRDLNLDLEIVPHPTVREPDGLAMSSRNVYLTPEEREQAVALNSALQIAKRLVDAGERRTAAVMAAIDEELAKAPLGRLDYAEARSLPDLDEVGENIKGPTLLALAVFFSRARLIDNVVLLREQWNSAPDAQGGQPAAGANS